MTPQFEAAWRVHTTLTERGIPYAILGGIAVQFWGQPRFTKDLDLTVLVDPGQERALAEDLAHQFPARHPDAIDFAMVNRVLLLHVEGLCDLDVSLGLPGYESEVMERSVEVDLGDGRRVRVVSAEDLVIHKALAGRPRDIEDVRGVLLRRGAQFDAGLVRRWLQLLCELLESDEPLRLFEEVLRTNPELSA